MGFKYTSLNQMCDSKEKLRESPSGKVNFGPMIETWISKEGVVSYCIKLM